MRHLTRITGFVALMAVVLPAMGQAQTAGRATQAPVVKRDSVVVRDTVLVFHFRAEDSVQTALRAGFLYKAELNGQDIKLEVKSADISQRDVLVADVTNRGSTEMVARFTVQTSRDGNFIFRVTGAEPGRDVTLRLTVPLPLRATPTANPGRSGNPYSP